MKRPSIPSLVSGVLLGIAATIGTAYAVNFTIVLTQAQVDIATWQWTQEDPNHAIWSTPQLFGAAKVGDLIEGWKQRRRIFRISILGGPTGPYCSVTFPALNQSQKDAVCTGLPPLGVMDVAGCTPCSSDGS